ncbi:MAG: PDZ domain-containing protein [Zetaproteobacteria bacterium]|nr:PDZ domain-containing protein [Zetaproteobacteria bacterium]
MVHSVQPKVPIYLTQAQCPTVLCSWRAFTLLGILLCLTPLLFGQTQVLFPENVGFKWLGSIAEKDGGVILIKEVESSRVVALRKDGILLKKYKIIQIFPKEVRLVDTQQEDAQPFSVYKKGFAPKGKQAVEKIVAHKPKASYSGSYKEEGFERIDQGIKITGEYKDHVVKNQLKDILLSASATPEFNEGELLGFIMDDIEPGSIFEKMGIRNLDIITAINGTPLDNIGATVKTLRSLQGESSASFEVMRAGERFTVTIDVQ